MAESNRDRINPSLLDRLTDEAPGAAGGRGGSTSLSELRKSVLRDLAWLFNTTQVLDAEAAEAWPQVRNSVLNYGLPALAGRTTSTLDGADLARHIRQAILDFEPRILPSTLQVVTLIDGALDQHNIIGVEIRGQLWAQPMPLELLLRTSIDLETGNVEIADSQAQQRVP